MTLLKNLALRLGLGLVVLGMWSLPSAQWAQALPTSLGLPYIARGVPRLTGEPWQILSHRLAPNLKGLIVRQSTTSGAQMELYRSSDDGRSWSPTPHAPWPALDAYSLDRFNARLLWIDGTPTWVVTILGLQTPRLWVLPDGGSQWTERAFPPAPSCATVGLQALMSTASTPGRLWVELTCNTPGWSDDGVWWSDNGGASWQALHAWATQATDWYGIPIGSATEAGLLYRFGRAWMRSGDRGEHWTRVSIPGDLLSISLDTAQVLTARPFGLVEPNYSSTDGGVTWRLWSAIPCPSGWLWQGAPIFVRGEPETIVMHCGTGEVARSSDLGQTWSLLTIPDGPPSGLAADDAVLHRLYAFIPDPGSSEPMVRLWVSPDGGVTWQDHLTFQSTAP